MSLLPLPLVTARRKFADQQAAREVANPGVAVSILSPEN